MTDADFNLDVQEKVKANVLNQIPDHEQNDHQTQTSVF